MEKNMKNDSQVPSATQLIDVFSCIMQPLHDFLDLNDELEGEKAQFINVCRALSASIQSQLDKVAYGLNEHLGGHVMLDAWCSNSLFFIDKVLGAYVSKDAPASKDTSNASANCSRAEVDPLQGFTGTFHCTPILEKRDETLGN